MIIPYRRIILNLQTPILFMIKFTAQEKIRCILMYQKKSPRKHDKYMQGYIGMGKLPTTIPENTSYSCDIFV